MYYPNQNAPYMGAYVPNYQPATDIAWTNPLTDKERAMLKEKDTGLVLAATEKELAQAKCTHRDPEKRCATLVQLSNGSWKCTQCGAEFNLVDLPAEEVAKYVYGLIDVIQTAKLMYVNLPPSSVVSYFSMIPFLEKLPKFYETAQDVFKRANGAQSMNQYQYTSNPWDMLNNAISNPGYGMPMNYGYQQQQPYYQAPPMQQYTPQQYNGFYADPAYNPLQQAPQGQPTQYFTGQQFMQPPVNQNPAPAGYNDPNKPAVTETTVPATQVKEGEVVKSNKQFNL